MSTYDDASLILIPSGVKDGKVYSAKPTNGDGDFTFTRASEATRLVDGVVTKVRTNLALYSNDFSNNYWQKISGCAIVGQTATDPLGVANNAWVVTFDGTSNGRLERNIATTGVKAMSIWARTQSGTQDVYIGFGTTGGITETLTTTWQRIETFKDTGTFPRLRCDDANTIEVYAVQVEQGTVATDYIATTTVAVSEGPVANMPRLNSVAGGCPSLLLEPQRTNLITQSEYFGGWDKHFDNSITVTDNSTTSPDGTQNAAKIEFDGSGYSYIRMSYTASAGVFSIYVKKGNWRYLGFRNDGSGSHSVWDFDTQTFSNVQTNHTMSFEALGDGWYRIMDYVSVSTGSVFRGVAITDTTGTETHPSGATAGSYVYLWGGQGENSAAYATSYIPNYGTTAGVTRVAESSITSANTLGGLSVGTFFIEMTRQGIDTSETGSSVSLRDNAGAEELRLHFDAPTSQVRWRDGNNSYAQVGNALPVTAGTAFKIIIKSDGTTAKVFGNGLQLGSDYSIVSAFDFQRIYNYQLGYEIKQQLFFPTALTDAECIELTTL